MKLSAFVFVPALAVGVVPLASGEHHAHQDPCRVAVAVSGDPRPFIDPSVHRSFRSYVVESIKQSDCRVDVFAYAMVEDDLDFLMQGLVRDDVCCCCCICSSVYGAVYIQLPHTIAPGACNSIDLALDPKYLQHTHFTDSNL